CQVLPMLYNKKMSSLFFLSFIKKEKIALDTYSFYLDRASQGFDFQAGEYIRMTLSIENPDERGSSRYFTIASSPLDKDFITITTRVIKSSFKKELLNLKPGQKVKIFGPLGNFIVDWSKEKKLVFLA